jgi:hypothetical protein
MDKVVSQKKAGEEIKRLNGIIFDLSDKVTTTKTDLETCKSNLKKCSPSASPTPSPSASPTPSPSASPTPSPTKSR